VDVDVEWVVVETVELSVARLVLTCAVATAARPRLRRAKNFIVAILRTSLLWTRVGMWRKSPNERRKWKQYSNNR
jgi:hypothetical protein